MSNFYSHPRCIYCANKSTIDSPVCSSHAKRLLKDHNVFIETSDIPGAGFGLFAGNLGFLKGDPIGEYKGKTTLHSVFSECKYNRKCWEYILCEHESADPNQTCWTGDSYFTKYINDPTGSPFRANAKFNLDSSKQRVMVIATRDIPPLTEIYINYGRGFWNGVRV